MSTKPKKIAKQRTDLDLDEDDGLLHWAGKADLALSEELGIDVPMLCGVWFHGYAVGGGKGKRGESEICPNCEAIYRSLPRA